MGDDRDPVAYVLATTDGRYVAVEHFDGRDYAYLTSVAGAAKFWYGEIVAEQFRSKMQREGNRHAKSWRLAGVYIEWMEEDPGLGGVETDPNEGVDRDKQLG